MPSIGAQMTTSDPVEKDSLERSIATSLEATGGEGPQQDAAIWGSDLADSLHFVRDVAERIREVQRQSSNAIREAQQAARIAITATWAAEERAARAEADAAAALNRAEEAEEQLRRLTERLNSETSADASVDRLLHDAYQQLRRARETYSDPAKS